MSDHQVRSPLADVRIVLVEPSHPGNIGGAARAMKTMGFSKLTLVAPRRYPDPQAEWRAAGAKDVLNAANVCASIDEAIADCVVVAGTSARRRRIPWPMESAAAFARRLAEEGSGRPAAIVFGREDRGLSNDELQRCSQHVVIPANPDYASLNLAMAVQVVCYEIYQALAVRAGAGGEAEQPPAGARTSGDRRRASAGEVGALLAHWERVLVRVGFLDPAAPRRTMVRLRRLLQRAQVDETEAAILRGALTRIERALESVDSPGSADGRGKGSQAPRPDSGQAVRLSRRGAGST